MRFCNIANLYDLCNLIDSGKLLIGNENMNEKTEQKIKKNTNRTLSARIPELEYRAFKSEAALKGVSVQNAVIDAIRKWIEVPTLK